MKYDNSKIKPKNFYSRTVCHPCMVKMAFLVTGTLFLTLSLSVAYFENTKIDKEGSKASIENISLKHTK
jgi:hypothetical protein